MAKKIVIDAGHGGEDPGTSANGIVEKDYTLKISQYMAKRLSDLGIENSLTRNSDVTLDSNNRPKKAQSFYGTGNDVIVVSNHINAGGGDGAEVIYALRNSDNLSRRIAEEFVKAGQNVRKYYQRRLPSDSSKDYYYMLRNTPNNETVIVEYGFADSTGDDVSQLKNNWQDLTEAIVKALAGYVGVPYTPPTGGTGSVTPMPGNTYVVKKGDSLYAIAREYGISVDELKRANNLSSNNLSIGMVLTIPKESVPSENIYIVKPGDSLYKIANMYGMSVNELKSLNNLSSNLLSIGQQLKVSESADIPANTYIVVSGDSLYSIAKKFNVSVDELKRVNNKTSNLLSIGEKLIIPNVSDMNYETYIVVPGDTLYGIARKYNTTVNAIREANNLNNTMLSIGMTLKIPR